MSTYTQILYQIVFGTWKREKILDRSNREKLFGYIRGILNNKKCFVYQIGGVADHIHIVTHIHPSISLALLVKDVKLVTSHYIKENGIFQNFLGWQSGYGAFTYSFCDKNRLIQYVKNQEKHHSIKSFRKELIELFNEHGVEYDERYMF